MLTTGKARLRRAGMVLAVLVVSAAAMPASAFASSLRTSQARQHLAFLDQLYQMALGAVPLLSMLAIVGGIIMFGISGGHEGLMKKLGLPIACFGVAGFVLTSGSFLGIGAAVL
ncbi:MAG: hypothetical protein JWM27_1208 [Gemmatimonadetes bacterium]|jgi:hypothetical protein|nr:hypothetical protein [Gemmatimonadota bacterium]HET6229552.1 hypothetical protein [Longimicrobiaceae bacterium]